MIDQLVEPRPGFEEADPLSSDVTRVPIPAGLWLRSGRIQLPEAENLAFRAVPEDTRFTLLVGNPGEPMPTAPQVADVVRSLERATQARLVLSVYGAESDEGISVAQLLADTMATPIRAHHGLVLSAPDGTAHRTAIDSAGQPTWQPFAQLSTYHPGGPGPVLERWRAPVPGAAAVGRGSYRLTDEWTVDVVPAGLLVRPTARVADPALTCPPTHPDRVDLVVDVSDGRVLPDGMLTALGRLADALPFAARSRLRVVLTPGAEATATRALRWAVPAP